MQELATDSNVAIVVMIVFGCLGTYMGFTRSRGRELFLSFKIAFVVWSIMAIFIVLFLKVSTTYRLFLWFPFLVILPLGIHSINKKRRQYQVALFFFAQQNQKKP